MRVRARTCVLAGEQACTHMCAEVDQSITTEVVKLAALRVED